MPQGNENDSNQSHDTDDQKPDPMLNIKTEFSRKLSKQDERLEELVRQNQALTEQIGIIAQAVKPKQQRQQQSEDEELADLAVTNPAQYARIVTDRATTAAARVSEEMVTAQAKRQEVLTGLMADYPELADPDNELRTRAIKIHGSLSKSDQASPMSYKTAVRDAAAELGLLPASKRKKAEDGEPSFSSSSGRSMRSQSSGKAKTKLSDATLEFAELVGFNIRDEKVVKSIEDRAKRKTWHRYRRAGDES